MKINATILVQAINFIGAYVLLRVLLFKPSIQAMQKEENMIAQLHTAIAYNSEQVEEKKRKQQQVWRLGQQFFEQNKPALDYPDRFIFRYITPQQKHSIIPEEQIMSLVQETSQALTMHLKKVI